LRLLEGRVVFLGDRGRGWPSKATRPETAALSDFAGNALHLPLIAYTPRIRGRLRPPRVEPAIRTHQRAASRRGSGVGVRPAPPLPQLWRVAWPPLASPPAPIAVDGACPSTRSATIWKCGSCRP